MLVNYFDLKLSPTFQPGLNLLRQLSSTFYKYSYEYRTIHIAEAKTGSGNVLLLPAPSKTGWSVLELANPWGCQE
jgi:hypothetical protein